MGGVLRRVSFRARQAGRLFEGSCCLKKTSFSVPVLAWVARLKSLFLILLASSDLRTCASFKCEPLYLRFRHLGDLGKSGVQVTMPRLALFRRHVQLTVEE
jgi:hypothetical protein